MTTKLIIYFLVVLFLTSCIGDALVMVKYSVKNKTNQTLTVKSKTNWSFDSIGRDATVFVLPHSEKAVYTTRFICAFSDCRYNIKNNNFLDSVGYYFAGKPEQYVKLKSDKWKIKRNCAKAIVKSIN